MDKIRTLHYTKYLILLAVCLCVSAVNFSAQTVAPGGPGNDAYWATAAKQGIGTSASLESKVWFTLADGVMTEVYYPDVTTANVHLLQFVVVNPKTKKVETERDDSTHEVRVLRPDSLTFQQINTARSGDWKIVKTYATDLKLNSVAIDVRFEAKDPDLNLYVYFDPSISNTGMHDTALTEENAFVSMEAGRAVALKFSGKVDERTNGFLGTSDGSLDLKRDGRIINQYRSAKDGNVVQTGRIVEPQHFLAILTFASDAKILGGLGRLPADISAVLDAESVKKKGFEKCLAEYEKGWADFVKTLPRVDAKYQAQFNMAAMVLKAQEDKTVRGANVASLTIPWGGGKNANEDVGGGYHLVWARDLYEVFTAYMALGQKDAANRALDFLSNIQQKPDGSFPQNSWLDGRNGWGGLQMDEVGYPLIMAWQLSRFDKQTYEKHVKPAADFIVKNGPMTPQERWEEKGGYSPSTIAAEIAGLVCAADIATRNGDASSADLYLKTADEWQANIEKWTATTNGPYGDGHYYVRLTQGHPDAGEKIELNNGAGFFKENEIVDAGFLELVRLGIKPADDPLIKKSVEVVDQQIKVDTPNGPAFYRYSHDGYGEMEDGRRWNFDGKYTGKGRPWPLLSGERGQYELAFCSKHVTTMLTDGRQNAAKYDDSRCPANFQQRLDAMLGFANEGLMIPEQVWDKKEVPSDRDREFVPELKFGEGTGSATPLAWSMAQFIRLAMNIKAGKNLDTPQVVYDRYARNSGQNADAVDQNPPVSETITMGSPQQLPPSNRYVDLAKLKPFNPDDLDCMLRMSTHREDRERQRFPIARKCRDGSMFAVFAHKGKAKDVQIAGDFNGWKPTIALAEEEKYAPLISDIDPTKYYSAKFAATARVEYKLIVDGKWITDPLNPNKIDNGVGGENSVFTMPDYKPTEWDKCADCKQGEEKEFFLEGFHLPSQSFGTKYITVYQPKECVDKPCPVLYLQDGSDYDKRAHAAVIEANLVRAHKVVPFIMVFLDPKDRNKEYWANDDYAKYLATEVVPAVDAKYRTLKYPEGRGVMGASLGGVTSVWTAIKYPDVFGRVGGQSSSFWIDDRRVLKELAELDASKTKLRFYLAAGTLEGTKDTEDAATMLREKGFKVDLVTREAGHNWTAWRDRLADAFIDLFGV